MNLLIFLLILPVAAFSQMHLSGPMQGTYTAESFLISDAHSTGVLSLHTCIDKYIPGIAVLGDSCIRDAEWISGGYADVLTDSAAFFTPQAMALFNKFEVRAVDDCQIDSFHVKSLEIFPPGGVDRPSGTREFRILLRAVDGVGRAKEALMIWIRKDNNSCI